MVYVQHHNRRCPFRCTRIYNNLIKKDEEVDELKTEMLRYILGIDKKEFDQLKSMIVASDSAIGKGLITEGKVLFDISVYSFYPLLFREVFEINDPMALKCAILFSRYYSGWLFILDKNYDASHTRAEKNDLLVMSRVLSSAEWFLHQLLPLECKDGWMEMFSYRVTNDIEMVKEKNHYSYEKSFSDEELFSYCKNKYVLSKAVLFLCAFLSNKTDSNAYHAIALSHDYFAVGRQIMDEIMDLAEDYAAGKFNIYAYKLMQQCGDVVDKDEVRNALLSEANKYFLMAYDVLDDLPDFGWKRFVHLNLKKATGGDFDG